MTSISIPVPGRREKASSTDPPPRRGMVPVVLFFFVLWTNLAVVLTQVHGVPQLIGSSVVVLLLIPIVRALIVDREAPVVTPVLPLVLIFLGTLFLAGIRSPEPSVVQNNIGLYLTEGLLLYLLVSNAVTDPSRADRGPVDAHSRRCAFGRALHRPGVDSQLRERVRGLCPGRPARHRRWLQHRTRRRDAEGTAAEARRPTRQREPLCADSRGRLPACADARVPRPSTQPPARGRSSGDSDRGWDLPHVLPRSGRRSGTDDRADPAAPRAQVSPGSAGSRRVDRGRRPRRPRLRDPPEHARGRDGAFLEHDGLHQRARFGPRGSRNRESRRLARVHRPSRHGGGPRRLLSRLLPRLREPPRVEVPRERTARPQPLPGDGRGHGHPRALGVPRDGRSVHRAPAQTGAVLAG